MRASLIKAKIYVRAITFYKHSTFDCVCHRKPVSESTENSDTLENPSV